LKEYKEYLDKDNIGKINDNEEMNNWLYFINEPDNENIIKFFKQNENQIKFIIKYIINFCLPFSILLFSLFQLYFQYSYLVYPKNQKKDNKNGLKGYLTWFFDKKEEEEKPLFAPIKIKEKFDYNPIIFLIKSLIPKGSDKSTENNEINSDQINAMIFFYFFMTHYVIYSYYFHFIKI